MAQQGGGLGGRETAEESGGVVRDPIDGKEFVIEQVRKVYIS